MKHIYLNLKRFDIPKEAGGVNALAPIREWGAKIIRDTQDALREYNREDVEFAMYFPEAHLIPALEALGENSPIQVGCQGVFRADTECGGNFGAFTTGRTANAMRALGCESVLIGHCEERRDKSGIMRELMHSAGTPEIPEDAVRKAVNRILNQEIREAVRAGMKVLYCIGESAEEQPVWRDVLKEQLETGLAGVERSEITIAYEPIWAIGPGKTPPDQAYMEKIGAYVKEVTGGMDVVYGGGLKKENAKLLAGVPSMDGGLIALTRFSGEIGFYPEEYLEIIRLYMDGVEKDKKY
ncbi:triose-phosphate isomerase [Brotaphodocola sp.]|uniref:triose-phosphate isomerase n=1 Tax=Brotaphodocola sp. TaxID=3073577 RepID=UPI003D7E8390